MRTTIGTSQTTASAANSLYMVQVSLGTPVRGAAYTSLRSISAQTTCLDPGGGGCSWRTGRRVVHTIWKASHMDQTDFFRSDVTFG